ncbi:hypothetical protein BMF94_1990 [Rhodotorula taiwanensis]|uniref:F-box domain-containing protein n=1 Tax=Rhodotorula taiwanensis TaxID=741276 RepID=A0A2S5BE18_9BASI|nr:hypothetical protein BMF94_1990 [Rhodotorula taiwanensis]
MPAFRLPLELELHILDLATPHRLLPSLKRRVKFLRKIALVHRSFTAWAQARLREQFVFTYRTSDPQLLAFERRRQQAELLTDWKPECFLLDLRNFFYADEYDCNCTKSSRRPSTDSLPRAGLLHMGADNGGLEATGNLAAWPARFARFLVYLTHLLVRVCTFDCPPIVDLDDSSCGITWEDPAWGFGQTSQASALTLRHLACSDFSISAPHLTQLVLVQCEIHTSLTRICKRFPELADLFSFRTDFNSGDDDLAALPQSLRQVVIASTSADALEDYEWTTFAKRMPRTLQTFTFTLLQADVDPDEDSARAAVATQHVARLEQTLHNTGTRFTCRIATNSDEEELATVMLALGL